MEGERERKGEKWEERNPESCRSWGKPDLSIIHGLLRLQGDMMDGQSGVLTARYIPVPLRSRVHYLPSS